MKGFSCLIAHRFILLFGMTFKNSTAEPPFAIKDFIDYLAIIKQQEMWPANLPRVQADAPAPEPPPAPPSSSARNNSALRAGSASLLTVRLHPPRQNQTHRKD